SDMNVKAIITPVFALLTCPVFSQNIDWELFSPLGNYSKYDKCITVRADQEGNVYTASYFEGSIVINDDTLYAGGLYKDMVIIKYNENKEVEWYKEIDLDLINNFMGFDLDSQGDLIIASEIIDTLFLDTIVLEPEVERSGFIAKIKKTGEAEWAKRIFSGYPTVHALSLSANDDIFVAGESWNGGFLARLDKFGNTIWKWDINSPSGGNNVWGSDIKPAPDNSTYGVLMFKSNQINVTPDITLYNPYPWGGQMVLFKFDENGDIVWFSQNTQGIFIGDTKIEVDKASNIFLTGNFNNAPLQLGDLELPTPEQNRTYGFISKCSAGKQWEWLTQRDPWPNLSYDIAYDCINEVIYSTGLRTLEVFSTQGVLENQMLFDEEITRCFTLDIGRDNNIVFGGVSRNSLTGTGSFDGYNPFIASVNYNSLISNVSCLTTAVKEYELPRSNVRIFPSIVQHTATIEIAGSLDGAQLLVQAADGRVLFTQTFSTPMPHTMLLDTSAFPPGMIFVTIVSSGGISTGKMIK
ncbi:MAG: hypothetical protein L6Q97_20105, partial [Thermoanaerobaculia bacterium]|nr:hypothetical protein [Thermoanaerobaculia bacterium]